ncbi:hypothetical protein GCM10010398_03430 [Streptomyces fimbriatus]
MSIASGGVAVRPPRRNVTSRLVRRAVARSADAALAVGFAVGCGAWFVGECAVESVFDVGFVVGFDMDGPPSGMWPLPF